MKKAPTPEAVAAEMSRVVRVANEIADMAQAIVDEYAELNDGAYRRNGNGGFERPISGGDFRATDPTGDVATNREAHGTASHEALAYDQLNAELARTKDELARLREEKMVAVEIRRWAFKRMERAEAQRDILLAALREIIEQSETDTWYTEIAEAAISEVEGEK